MNEIPTIEQRVDELIAWAHYAAVNLAEDKDTPGDKEALLSGARKALIARAAAQGARIAELEATLNVHYKCLDRALQLYLARHPDSISWPDGAQSIVDMVERYEELKLVGRKVLEELGSPAAYALKE